jgi:hypothetical protein
MGGITSKGLPGLASLPLHLGCSGCNSDVFLFLFPPLFDRGLSPGKFAFYFPRSEKG